LEDIGQVALEHVIGELVASQFAGQLHGNTVIGKAVVLEADLGIRLERRKVGTDADSAIDNFVVLDQDVGGFLEAECHAGCPVGVGYTVIAGNSTLHVHEVNTHRVIVELVVLDDVVVGEHEVDGVTAAAA